MMLQRAVILLSISGCMQLALLDVPEHTPITSTDAGIPEQDGGPAADPCAPNPCRETLKTQCSVIDGDAVCACNEGARAVGDACLPEEACDDGDCPGGALSLVRGEAIEGSLNRNGGDTSDWFLLSTPSTGGIERFRVDLIGDSGPDAVRGEGEVPPQLPNIELFVAPDVEQPVRHVPRQQVEEDGRFHRFLSAEIAANSVVLLRLVDADELPVSYRLLADPVITDDHVDGEAGATEAAAGDHSFSLETREDTDVFVITTDSDGALLASVSLAEPGEDASAISLRIGSVGGNDHQRYYGRARHPVSAGNYTVRIDHREGRLVSGQLHVRLLVSDDHGDRAEEASPITVDQGQVVQGALVQDDTDWLAFRAQANALYRIVYSGSGTLRGRRADDADFVWNHAAGQVYRHDGLASDMVLEVSGVPHDYTVMVFGSPLADPAGNRISTAQGLAEDETAFDLSLEYVGDVDYYGPFVGEAALCFGFWEPFVSGVQVELVDDQGQQLSVVTDSGDGRVAEQNLAFGFHYLRVARAAEQAGSYPIAYRLRVNMAGCP